MRDHIQAGFSCSENRVVGLMKAAGIKACHKRRRAPGKLEPPVHAIAPNLLDQQFEATGPNRNGRPTLLTRGLANASCLLLSS